MECSKVGWPSKGQFVPPRVLWQNLLLRSRPSLAVQLACLAGDVVLHAPVETAAYSVVAGVAAVALVAWSQGVVAGDLWQLCQLPGRRAWLLESCGSYVSCLVAERGCGNHLSCLVAVKS